MLSITTCESINYRFNCQNSPTGKNDLFEIDINRLMRYMACIPIKPSDSMSLNNSSSFYRSYMVDAFLANLPSMPCHVQLQNWKLSQRYLLLFASVQKLYMQKIHMVCEIFGYKYEAWAIVRHQYHLSHFPVQTTKQTKPLQYVQIGRIS